MTIVIRESYLERTRYTQEQRDEFKRRREALGWTVADVARKAHLPGANIESFENGGYIDPGYLKKAEHALTIGEQETRR